MLYTRRWRGRSERDVSDAMSELAKRRVRGMTRAQKVAQGRAMVAQRGTRWHLVNGKRIYYDE